MISIIIPAYNEEDAIAGVVKNVRAVLEKTKRGDFEILVVDDGSADRTAALAMEAGARVIKNLHNVGYGFSLKQGIKAATHDTIAITDADGTYPVEKLPELLEKFEEGFNLVVGQRTGPHYRESLVKFPLRIIFKYLVEFTVGRHVPDVNSGLRVFSRREIEPYIPRLSDKFSFTTSQTLAYMLNKKFVSYVPIEYKERIGKTKIRLIRDSLGAMQMLISAIAYFNPLKLYFGLCAMTGITGVVLIAISLGWDITGALWPGVIAILMTFVIFAIGLHAELLRQVVARESNYK